MKLFFREYGAGPPLFILHGLYGLSDNWVTLARKISSSFRVIVPDLRNHGQSPHHQEHNYLAISEDINELAAGLGITKFFLAGHSMGGKAAATLAVHRPELIYGLVIADIAPVSSADEQALARKQHEKILKTILAVNPGDLTRREKVDSLLSEGIPSEKVRLQIMKNIARTVDNTFRWRLNARALLDNLDKITGNIPLPGSMWQELTGFPVLLLKGENSDYLNDENIKGTLRIFPGAELVVIKNAGHWLHADNPEAVSSAINGLLNY
jgi:pimeloyl-ACP methyl ester carboxylesterase